MKKMVVACAVSAAVSMFASFAAAKSLPNVSIYLHLQGPKIQRCQNLYFDVDYQSVYCEPTSIANWLNTREDTIRRTRPILFSQVDHYVITDRDKQAVFSRSEAAQARASMLKLQTRAREQEEQRNTCMVQVRTKCSDACDARPLHAERSAEEHNDDAAVCRENCAITLCTAAEK